jgi:hypothetical protein
LWIRLPLSAEFWIQKCVFFNIIIIFMILLR